MDVQSNGDAGPVTPHRNTVSVSGDYLRQERASHEITTSNVVPLEKYDHSSGEPLDDLHVHGHGPGTAPEHVYEANMAWWRFAIRRKLVANLEHESRWIAAMQASSCSGFAYLLIHTSLWSIAIEDSSPDFSH